MTHEDMHGDCTRARTGTARAQSDRGIPLVAFLGDIQIINGPSIGVVGVYDSRSVVL